MAKRQVRSTEHLLPSRTRSTLPAFEAQAAPKGGELHPVHGRAYRGTLASSRRDSDWQDQHAGTDTVLRYRQPGVRQDFNLFVLPPRISSLGFPNQPKFARETRRNAVPHRAAVFRFQRRHNGARLNPDSAVGNYQRSLGRPFRGEDNSFYHEGDRHGRCMGAQSSSADDELPSCDNLFETARSGVFATPGSPQAQGMPDLQQRNPG
jgi:hypothetical protein